MSLLDAWKELPPISTQPGGRERGTVRVWTPDTRVSSSRSQVHFSFYDWWKEMAFRAEDPI